MEHRKSQLTWGIFLILLGVVFLLGNISRVGMDTLWPIFPLAVGLMFFIGYFHDRKNYGLLMPGSILVVVGLLFFYCNFAGWWRMETLWPVFILAPAVGFVAMHWGGAKEWGISMLIPAGILGGIAVIFLFLSTGVGDYWPVFLILAGILLILFHGKWHEKDVKKK